MIKAKKQYGQNFLKDESVLRMIIEAMPKNENKIIEIGPGLGDLTEKLVKYKEVKAYEVDGDLYSILKVKFFEELSNQQLEIELIDVLKVWKDKGTLYQEGKYDLIANLPYYIATNIILNCFEDDNCEHIIVMVQKEVGDKFISTCGEKEYSSLGVIAESLCSMRKEVVVVPPTSFDPAPKVDSSVIYLKKDMTKSIDTEFKNFLKVAFSQPRKKLLKNLSIRYDKQSLNDLFEKCAIDLNIRPHELNASLYSKIYQSL
jgi:16S rRNA (adenine1518-N6/adenine1519-N6)-dimethyltransferase